MRVTLYMDLMYIDGQGSKLGVGCYSWLLALIYIVFNVFSRVYNSLLLCLGQSVKNYRQVPAPF